jgi:lipopolysaccharide transport system ATP-binding protein
MNAVRIPFQRRKAGSRPRYETIWALKEVSFDVRPGEAVGIIGRNGAGKSTLLKILSRITEPTGGKAKIYGRVGSLLEVGTGFHPELTGRENIFLNGAIIGMRRAEIRQKFDEIVAFSEVEKFIDTPIKWYSSGMYLRLAFSVAAHLDPEILIVDEVLAVGDARFQRKCLDKIQDVGEVGRTVLFVSHSMPAITRLCPRAILIDHGTVMMDGPSHQVVKSYLEIGVGTSAVREWKDISSSPGNQVVRLCAVRVRDENGEISEALDIRRPVAVEIEYEVIQSGHVLTPNFSFHNEDGIYVFGASDLNPRWRSTPRPAGRYVTTAWIPGNFLAEGTLFVGAAVSTMNPVIVHFYERDVVAFRVVDSLEGGTARGEYGGPVPGLVRPALQWETETARDMSERTNSSVALQEVMQ